MPFVSKAQARYFYAKAKHSKKWKKRAKEWSDKTDWSKLESYLGGVFTEDDHNDPLEVNDDLGGVMDA